MKYFVIDVITMKIMYFFDADTDLDAIEIAKVNYVLGRRFLLAKEVKGEAQK